MFAYLKSKCTTHGKRGVLNMPNIVYSSKVSIHTRVTPMSQQTQEVVANLGPKIGGIWLAIGVSSWSEAAAFLAFILSFLALSEWMWKKAIRPTLAHMGYVKPIKRKIKMVEVDDDE